MRFAPLTNFKVAQIKHNCIYHKIANKQFVNLRFSTVYYANKKIV